MSIGMTPDSAQHGDGVANPGSGLLGESGPDARASRIRSVRAEALAALEKGDVADADRPAAKAVETADAISEEAPAESAVESDVEAGTDEALPTTRPAEKPDAETAKRLASVQAAEKRSREKLAAERAKFDAERAELAKERAAIEAERAEVAAYKKARERADVDPVSLLEAAGVKDLEYAAKQAYAKAKADPANKEAAARLLKEKELAEEIAELKKWRADRDKADQERVEVESAKREAAAYMADLTKAVTAGEISPLAKHFLAKSPEKTNMRLGQITLELLNETGDRPDIEDVLARYEKTRRAELEELGVDPSALLTPKKNDQAAEKKHSAKTLGNDLSTPRVPRPKSSEREQRAETRALFEQGKLD